MQNDKIKTMIIEIINEKPRLSQKVTNQWLSLNGGYSKLKAVANILDLEIAKLMMDWIPSETWRKVETSWASKLGDLEIGKEFIQAITVLELTWEENQQELNDPFRKVQKLSAAEKTELLKKFSPEEWALISAFWDKESTYELAKHFAPQQRRSFVVGLERLKKIPKESLLSTANSFANRVNLALESESSIDSQASQYVYTPQKNNPPSQELLDQAIETFVEIKMKDAEIESKITEYLEEVDPDLSERLNKILQSSSYENISEAHE